MHPDPINAHDWYLLACVAGTVLFLLLLVARLIQGISLGGEYGTSATYLSEVATSRHRGFYSSFQYVTLIGGQVLGSATLLAMQAAFTIARSRRRRGEKIPGVST